MQTILISRPDRHISAELTLDGSKSISNRALIIRALCENSFPIENLSTSKDTCSLLELLSEKRAEYDAGNAGTTFRFLTAYFALQPGSQILTGSERMKKRPVGALVSALNRLGCDVEFLENDGFPPLRINPPKNLGKNRSLAVPANVSSQFISSLLMIGPCLPDGLEIELMGEVVSRSYIEMTIEQMRFFGAEIDWRGNLISVKKKAYEARPFVVESDWSAASYWFAVAALSDFISLKINGLHEKSWQGDAVLPAIFEGFGVKTTFAEGSIFLKKNGSAPHPFFEKNFIECPDIAQTMAVVCGALGVRGVFTGLDTLAIKETDRIAALKKELAKIGVSFAKLPPGFSKKQPGKTFFLLEGRAEKPAEIPRFSSYDDHRMAMSFAPLGLLFPVEMEEPEVVEKSYPDFWSDFEKAGFSIEHRLG